MMNKPVIAGIAAGILLAGIILGPLPGIFSAEAQEDTATTGKTKKVTLIANEVDVPGSSRQCFTPRRRNV